MRNLFKQVMAVIICCNVLLSSSLFPMNVKAADLDAYTFVNNMKTGWNLGNSLDSHYGEPTGNGNLSQETIWGNPKVTKQQIDFVKAQGFDVIRVPVSWYTHTYRDANGTIHISPEWIARVREVIDYCIADGFYVIINTHHDGKIFHCGVSDSDFTKVKSDASSIWNEIASSFAAYDQHLIFEAYNEIDNLEKPWNFGKKAANQMNELNQIFVNTVRSTGGNNSQRLLMVPTLLDQSTSKFQKAFILPTDSASNKLIVTVHKYAQNFDQSLDSTFADISTFSKNIGAPIIIGEWGTTNKFSPAQYRAIHASNFIARANKYNLKCIYWDNGSDYAIINRKALSSNQEMIKAIMNPKEFTSDASSSLASYDNYLYKTINQSTGELKDDKHWGTILVNTDGKGGYPIPSGKSSIYIGLVTSGNMSDQRIHYVYFFDADNKITGMINNANGFNEKVTEIPPGTIYARIGVNNSYSKTSEKEYKDAIENGTFRILINLY